MAIDRNSVIKNDCCEVFSLDKYNYNILGEFANRGEMNRNQINYAELSDRQISRRVDSLYNRNFIRIVRSEPYRNIKGKTVKIFGLTMKGLLASLKKTNVEDNYIIKNYLEQFKDEKLEELELNYIKNFLVYFFAYNRIRGILLDRIKNIGAWFYDFETKTGFTSEEIEEIKQKKKWVNTSFNAVEVKLKSLFSGEVLQKKWITMNRWHKSIEEFIVNPSLTSVENSMEKTKKEILTKKTNLHIINIDDESNDLYRTGIRINTCVEIIENR